MYAIVEFESKEIETLPLAWLVDSSGSKPLQIGSRVSFYWPPVKSAQQIANAIKKGISPETSWKVYRTRVLGLAKNYEEARQKSKKAEMTSDLQTDEDGPKKKRRRFPAKPLLVYESSSDHTDAASDLMSDVEPSCGEEGEEASASEPTDVILKTNNAKKPSMKVIKRTLDKKRKTLHSGIPGTTHQMDIRADSSTDNEDPPAAPLPSLSSSNSTPVIRHGSSNVKSSCASQHSVTTPSLSTGSASVGNFSSRMLLKIVHGIENIKETQKLQGRMLQSLMKQRTSSISSAPVVLPDTMKFPLATDGDVTALDQQLQDTGCQNALISVLADVGGYTLEEFVKRCMTYLFTGQLARSFNLTGQRGKSGFKQLVLFNVLHAAVKRNCPTSSASLKDLEMELRKWFGNARDRGDDSRKKCGLNRRIADDQVEDGDD